MVLLLFSVIGCSGDASKYEEAKNKGDITSYQEYLSEYPEGKFAKDARDAILLAVQEDENGVTHDVRMNPQEIKKLYIDSQYVVFPLGAMFTMFLYNPFS